MPGSSDMHTSIETFVSKKLDNARNYYYITRHMDVVAILCLKDESP